MPTALSFRPQKSDKTTRPVGHSSTCTSDLYRRRARHSRLCLSAGRAGPGRTGPHIGVRPRRAGPAAPGRAGPRRAVTGARPGFRTRPAARLRRTRPGRLRHATGGRASERDEASAHTTGPGFGTPLAQLIPRRRIGLCRRFPRFLQLSPF